MFCVSQCKSHTYTPQLSEKSCITFHSETGETYIYRLFGNINPFVLNFVREPYVYNLKDSIKSS